MLRNIMWLKALDTKKAAEVGTSLADQFVTTVVLQGQRKRGKPAERARELQTFLAQAEREALSLDLGLFRRARLANSFKWRLLDSGVEQEVVDELTQMLLMRLSGKPGATPLPQNTPPAATPAANGNNVENLIARIEACAARGAHAEVIENCTQLLRLKPRHAPAHNSLGVALFKLGRYEEAQGQFRRAAAIQSNFADAQFNLGSILRCTGQVAESEQPLRRALKLSPKHVEAHVSLGSTLVQLGRLREARQCFDRALRLAPRHAGALCGIGRAASLEGHFGEAEFMFKRALEFETNLPSAWAGLASLRKMTRADSSWLRGAEKIAASGITPLDEADLRFAIGKYGDDVGDFELAFRNYQRANELQKQAAHRYDPKARTSFVDEMIQAYPREAFGAAGEPCCDSVKPVLVTGMMRSGTSLVEQIISSHPAAVGAGELPFWNDVMRKYPDAVRNRWSQDSLRKKLAESYLQVLHSVSADAQRVVDKSTFNSDYLGPIHLVFPNARIIYVRRDPIDTCLSCYFHQFSTAHNFAMDLADLVHYYREHQRLVSHWRTVLPPGSLLEVPYAELVGNQEVWTRRIVEFIGLPWDDRCLEFHATQRSVITASFWQVRQKMYRSSVGRWRNYEKFIGPLRALQESR
jgi:tetratricopeptide (TPR) repeat protein